MRGGPSRTRAVLTLLTAMALLWCLTGAVQAREPRDGSATSPTDATAEPAAGQAWVPSGEFAGRLSFDLGELSPAVVTAAAGDTLTLTARVTNTGPDVLAGLTARFQRGDRLTDSQALQDRIAGPEQPIAVIQPRFTPLDTTLDPGASAEFTLTAPLTGTTDGGLGFREPGVYPLMVNVNGEVRTPEDTREARVGELHVLVTVLSLPAAPPGTAGAGAASPTDPPAAPVAVPVDLTWPLADRPHLGVDGVFLDDDLVAEISPGGRLHGIATALAGSGLPRGSATAVVDPRLLDEVDRMTRGYRVLEPGTRQGPLQPVLPVSVAPPTPTATLPAGTATGTAGNPGTVVPTRTATGPPAVTPSDPGPDPAAPAGTVAGRGTAAAQQFLTLLRDISAARPTVVLPYADPDVVALVQAGLDGQLTRSIALGREVAQRVLTDPAPGARPPDLDVTIAFPPGGAMDDATAAALMAAGYTSAVLSPATLAGDTGQPGTVTVDVPAGAGGSGGALPAVVADTQVLPDGAVLAAAGRGGGWASRLNVMAAILAQRSLDGTDTTPTVLVPGSTTDLTVADLSRLAETVEALAGAGAVTGAPLRGLTSGTRPPAVATLDYPDAFRQAQLDPGYLGRLADLDRAVTSTGTALLPPQGPDEADPSLVLDPLRTALDVAASTSLRTDLGPGVAVLDTVEATLNGLQDGVGIASSGGSYTLASSTSPLVVTLRNTTPYRVQVGLQLTGGQVVGLTAVDPGPQVLLPGRSLQVPVQTTVSRVASFVVTSRLVSPDGRAWGRPVQLPVRSTGFGAFTVIIVAVAGAVLLLMVVLRIRQRVRDRRDRLAAEAAAAAAPPDDSSGTQRPDDPQPGVLPGGDASDGAQPGPAFPDSTDPAADRPATPSPTEPR